MTFYFPELMLQQRRWMVRPTDADHAKRPQSPLSTRPDECAGQEKWQYAWADPAVWGTFECAVACWAENADIAGLCYVLHPAGDATLADRLICFDFDKAIDEAGVCDPVVSEFLRRLSTFVEVSLRGRGLHAFVVIENTEPLKNKLQQPIGNCKVDILCSSYVAVTGEVYEQYNQLRRAPRDILDEFGVDVKRVTDSNVSHIWTDKYQRGRAPQFVDVMQNWSPCYRSSKGSTLGEGGDAEFFRAACYLAQRGVTGAEADELLQYVTADPPFTEDERRHKIESAFRILHAAGEFGEYAAENEFDVVKQTDEPKADSPFGFTPIPLNVLEEMDLEIEYAVDRLFVADEGLFIGGREKCFKTGLAADLALSLATQKPFLGRFGILGGADKQVAFFTAEIGLRAAKFLFMRIRRAKDLARGSIDNLFIIDRLPKFQLDPRTGRAADPKSVSGLKKYFDKARPDVAIFDPLYLAMTGASVGDMYAVGGVLDHMTEICREYGVWPIFCHHARKDQTKEFQPMELGDLYGSGVSAFARQWALLSHAEPFQNGCASLYCNVGGSAAGDCGLWRIIIDEGQPDQLVDRQWNVTVEDEREVAAVQHDEAVLQALRYFGTPESVQSIASYAELDVSVTKRTLIALVKDGKADMSNNKFMIGSTPDE